MNASERLRALEPRGRAALKAPLTQAGRWDEEMVLCDLLDALPLIADVVEAAEAIPSFDGNCEGCRNARAMTGTECMWHGQTARGPLTQALTVLREHLEGK